MNKLEKLRLMRDLGGWKYSMLRIEDKLFGSHKAEPYLYEYVKNADKSMYPEMLKAMYKLSTGETLILDNPKSFNEKIQWMKLYDSTPLKTRLADKYLVRDWVAEKIGVEYLIPLLGVWDSFDEIDFDALPNQFVLKCNHGSGMNAVIKDKSTVDKAALKKQFDEWMEIDYSALSMEPHYKNIPRKIIAEKYLEQADKNLFDYKIHVFSGEPKIIQVIGDRDFENHTAKECFLTPQWRSQELMYHTYDQYDVLPPKPSNFAELLNVASKLGRDFSYVRVDLYDLENRILFGEMTFTPLSGFGKWNGNEHTLVGSWIDLNRKTTNET